MWVIIVIVKVVIVELIVLALRHLLPSSIERFLIEVFSVGIGLDLFDELRYLDDRNQLFV